MLPGPAEVRKGLGIDPRRRAETLEQEKCHFWRDRIPITRICSPGPLNPPRLGQPCFTGLPRKMPFLSLEEQRRRRGRRLGAGPEEREKALGGGGDRGHHRWHLKDGLVNVEPLVCLHPGLTRRAGAYQGSRRKKAGASSRWWEEGGRNAQDRGGS